MSIWIEIIGCVAGVLTSASYVPQLIKLIHERKADGVSIHTYWCAFIGSVLWLGYGVLNQSIALIFFNGFNTCAAMVIVALLWQCKKSNRQSTIRG